MAKDMQKFWEEVSSSKDDYSEEVGEAIECLEEIYKAQGRNDKKALLAKYDSDILRLMLWLTYNNYLNFWLREIGSTKTIKGTTANNFPAFCKLLSRLSNREVTGNAAREEVDAFFETCTEKERNWYSAIYYRDMGIGVNTRTINTVMPGLIPVFEVQLASKMDWDNWEYEPNRYVAEPKMDGSRAIIFTDENGKAYDIVSRNGKQMYNVDNILKAVSKLGIKNSCLDCEVMATDWNDSISIIHTQTKHKNIEGLKAHIFDCVPIEDFKKGKCEIPLKKRTKKLRDAMDENPSKYLVKVPRYKVTGVKSLNKHLAKCIAEGFEGLILKDKNAPYESKRSGSWQKIKLETTYDSDIREVEISQSYNNQNIILLGKGEEVKKYKRRYDVIHGSAKYENCVKIVKELFNLGMISEAKKKETIKKLPEYFGKTAPMIKSFKVKVGSKEVAVGSGYSFEQRLVFAMLKDTLLGKFIEFKGQQDSKAVTEGVRFPVFIKFRPDKDEASVD